jgi:hypothetical protein
MRNVLFAIALLTAVGSAKGDLVLHWSFIEDFGEPNTYDQVGSRDGELLNGVIRGTDPNYVGIVAFPGVYSVKTHVNGGAWPSAPMEGGDFSMAVLFKCPEPNAPWGVMIGWDGLGLGIAYQDVWCTWTTPSAFNEVLYADVWTDTEWHHLLMTYVNSTYTRTIYLDGQSLGTDVLNPADGAGAGYWETEFVVGGRQDYYEVPGLCADAKVWNTALSPAEVLAEYEALLLEQKKEGDINEDGVVNFTDVNDLFEDWLDGCQ